MEGSSGFRPAPLDGILFYHRELNYMPGHTPLVSWLKGYMVPEMLGVGVGNTLMAQKPANYAGMQAEIKEFETKYAQKKEKIKACIFFDTHQQNKSCYNMSLSKSQSSEMRLESCDV